MLTYWMTSFMGHDRNYDITAARTELGYTPRVGLAEGLPEITADRATSRRGGTV